MNLFKSLQISTLLAHVLASFAFVVVLPTMAHAASSSISVSPPVAYLQAGDKDTTHIVTITNTSGIPLLISPTLVDFIPGEKSNQVIPLKTLNTSTLELLNPASISLKSNEKHQISAKIKKQLEPSPEVHSTLLIAFSGEEQQSNGTLIQGTIGSNLIVTPAMNEATKLKLIITPPKLIDSLRAFSLPITVTNLGDRAAQASGSAVLTNGKDTALFSTQIYPDVVLARSSRTFRFSHTQPENDQFGEVLGETFQYKPGWWIGPHTLHITITYFDGKMIQTEKMSTKILVLPISLSIIGILTLLSYSTFVLYSKKTQKS